MKGGGSVALGTFLLFVPQFLGIVILRDIIEVAVIVHDPAAVTAEGVFVPFPFGLFTPFLSVAVAEADACPGIEVDTYRDKFVIDDYGKRLPVLQAVDFSRAKGYAR